MEALNGLGAMGPAVSSFLPYPPGLLASMAAGGLPGSMSGATSMANSAGQHPAMASLMMGAAQAQNPTAAAGPKALP